MSLLFVEEDGWCLDQYGCDPNGKIIIEDRDIDKDECSQKCWEKDDATGFEIDDEMGRCVCHTEKLSKGKGTQGPGNPDKHRCYIRNRGNLNT